MQQFNACNYRIRHIINSHILTSIYLQKEKIRKTFSPNMLVKYQAHHKWLKGSPTVSPDEYKIWIKKKKKKTTAKHFAEQSFILPRVSAKLQVKNQDVLPLTKIKLKRMGLCGIDWAWVCEELWQVRSSVNTRGGPWTVPIHCEWMMRGWYSLPWDFTMEPLPGP